MNKLNVKVEKIPNSRSTSQIAERTLKFFYGNKQEAIQFVDVYYGPSGKYFGAHGFGAEIKQHIIDAKITKNKNHE